MDDDLAHPSRPGADPREGGGGPRARSARVPIVIAVGVVAVLAAGAGLVWRAETRVNRVALASEPRPVTVVGATAATFRQTHKYVGTMRPWIEANVGPQFISVYVDTVLVRPGVPVRRGDVLATLDCRNASASSQVVAAEARAIDARQRAAADETARMKTLLDGGFIDPNSVEVKQAEAVSEEARLASQRARMTAMALEVNDCILRAPFDGEVAARTIDPGAFVRPGTSVVSIVDRSIVRMTLDVPEIDFDVVAPGNIAVVHVLATNATFPATIARRSPAADPDTRTIHVEIDIVDPKRQIPVNTTAEASLEVGEMLRATAVPLYAASITGSKAALYVVQEGVAHKTVATVVGERGPDLFLEPSLNVGTLVVTEGQFALSDGERVAAKQTAYGVAQPSASSSPGTSALTTSKEGGK